MPLQRPYDLGVTAALEKFAMSRGRQMARLWGRQGNFNAAARAAEASFSPTSRPVMLGNVGGGAESNVNLMVAPHGGQARAQVWKQSLPGPAFSPELWKRRAQMGAELQGNPAFAQFLGESQGPKGSLIHKYEYVPGQATTSTDPGYMKTKLDSERAARGQGYTMRDTKPGNMVTPAAGGQPKLVDYMPFKNEELYSNLLRRKYKMPETTPMLTGQGEKLFPALGGASPEAHAGARLQEQQLRAKLHPAPPPVRFSAPPGTKTMPARLRAMG